MADLTAEHRLATYGSLGPGRPNHHQVSELAGTWTTGMIAGRLQAEGWGAALGYPVLTLDPAGEPIEVQILESPDLPDQWQRLDDFEGAEYQRVSGTFQTDRGPLEACIYVRA